MVAADRYSRRLPGVMRFIHLNDEETDGTEHDIGVPENPGEAWGLVLGEALCFTVSAVMSYLGIKETGRTGLIMDSLKRLHLGSNALSQGFFSTSASNCSVCLFLLCMS